MKKLHYLGLIVVILLLLVFINIFFRHNYIVLIDAGSNGSRLFIYEYTKTKQIPLIINVYSDSTKPGLSSYRLDPEAAAKSLNPLLDQAKHYFNRHLIYQSAVTVHVLATAGMRLLPPASQQAIYDSIIQNIHKNYNFKSAEARTITGKEEALYGWLSVNYLTNRFTEKLPTVGSIEMGGASSQIAFETDKMVNLNDFYIFTIANKQMVVFAKSFLGLGNNQSLQLINKNPQAIFCYPKGFKLTKNKGKFIYSNCKELFKQYILTFQITNLSLLLKEKKLIAYSAIYHTFNFFDGNHLNNTNNLTNQIQQICRSDWEAMQHKYIAVNQNFLGSACAMGVFVNTLLYDVYHLKPEQVSVAKTLNQQEITWTLGKLLFDLRDNS
jgi:apyrase